LYALAYLAWDAEMTRHKIGILVGSLRQGSINRKIALSVAEFAKGALDCRIIEIGDLQL
jgi:chromate reductase, NAD(P)H dehydrogenase (quinone)